MNDRLNVAIPKCRESSGVHDRCSLVPTWLADVNLEDFALGFEQLTTRALGMLGRCVSLASLLHSMVVAVAEFADEVFTSVASAVTL